jgi:hypothetical protein
MSSANVATDVATIPDGDTEAGVVDLQGRTITALEIPADFDGATLTFQVNGRPFHDNDDAAVSLAVTANTYRAVDTGLFAAIESLTIISNAAQAGAEAAIVVHSAHFTK